MSITRGSQFYRSIDRVTTWGSDDKAIVYRVRSMGGDIWTDESLPSGDIWLSWSSEAKRKTDTEGVTLGLRASSSVVGSGWMTA